MTQMTAQAIRDQVDAMASRLNEDGTINATHVSIEQTLRQRHALPSYVAELDGPGNFRPVPAETPPDVEWLEAHAVTIDVVQRGAQIGEDEVTQHLAVVLADPQRVVVLEGSRTRLISLLQSAQETLARMPPQRRDVEPRVPAPTDRALPTQAQAHRSPYVGIEQTTVVLNDPTGTL